MEARIILSDRYEGKTKEEQNLDYAEDSAADTDANFVLTGSNKMIEIQGSAEGSPFSRSELNVMTDLAEKCVKELMLIQEEAINKSNA